MSVVSFEDKRWQNKNQEEQYSWKIVDKMLEALPNGSLCDIGGSGGEFLKRHLDRGKNRILNIDVSEVAVKKGLNSGVPSACLDIEKELPFLENNRKFDFGLLLDVIEHTVTPDLMLDQVMKIAHRIIIVTPNFANVKFRLQLLFGIVPDECREKKGHCLFVTRKKLYEIVRRNGLKVVDEKFYIIGQETPIVALFSRTVGRLWPSLFATQFIVECHVDNRSPHDLPSQDMLAGEDYA